MAKNAGVAKWLKAQGLGPCHEGVRGFDSRPPHLVISIFQCFLLLEDYLIDIPIAIGTLSP